eukprot:5160271-Amphidinium_carterae.1
MKIPSLMTCDQERGWVGSHCYPTKSSAASLVRDTGSGISTSQIEQSAASSKSVHDNTLTLQVVVSDRWLEEMEKAACPDSAERRKTNKKIPTLPSLLF